MTDRAVRGSEESPQEGLGSRFAPGSTAFDWLLSGLAGLVAVGGYLLVKGAREGTLEAETLVSLPALILYAGALPAILLLGWAAAAGRAASPDALASLPLAYRPAAIGAIAFVAGFVLALLDIGSLEEDVVVGLVSPGALLLATGATLIASGPVLAFGARHLEDRRRAGRPDRLNGVGLGLAAAWLLAIPTLFVAGSHPWVTGAGMTLAPDAPFTTHTDLYAIPLARPGSVRLTATPTDDEVHPAVHPDGDRIAIARGPSVETLDIWLLAIDGTDMARVTDTPDAIEDGLTWSPDGTRLAWWSDLDEAAAADDTAGTPEPAPPVRADAPARPVSEAAHFDTWIAAADGSEPQRIAHPDTDEGVESWAPDGARLCGWLNVDGGPPDIHTFGLDGSAPVRVTDDPAADWSCSWSPDGSRLAFHSDRDGDYEIMTIAPDGSDERQLTDNDGVDMLPRWSPDGTSVAFISDASGEFEVYVMAPDGSGVRDVTQDPALDDGIYGIDWTPDGSTIIAASAGRPYAADVDASVRGAIAAIALIAVLLGIVVGLVLRYRPLPGTFTIALGVTGLLVGLLGDSLAAVAAGVVGGVATDLVAAWAGARPSVARVAVTGAIAAALITAVTFVVASFDAGLTWDGERIVSVVLLAALVGAACAAIAGRPAGEETSAAPTAPGPRA